MATEVKNLMSKVQSIENSKNNFVMSLQKQQKSCAFLRRISSPTTKLTGIMDILFTTFKESIEDLQADKRYFLEKLKMYNDMADALGDYLKDLNDAMENNLKPTEDDYDIGSSTGITMVIKDVKTAIPSISVAINAVGKSKENAKIRRTLGELRNQMGKITKQMKKLKKESEKKEKEKKRKKGKNNS